MNKQNKETVYVKVKDIAGNEFVCPLNRGSEGIPRGLPRGGFNELKDVKNISETELDNCFDGDVVGRYAGQLNIVDSGD